MASATCQNGTTPVISGAGSGGLGTGTVVLTTLAIVVFADSAEKSADSAGTNV